VTADGKGEAVLGLAFLLMGENSHDVTHRLSARLAEIRKTLPPGIDAVPVYERTMLVDRVLRTVRTNLIEGAILVVAVLFIFLGNLRAGLIVASAIPLSLLFAFDLMTRAGVAGSLMSLGRSTSVWSSTARSSSSRTPSGGWGRTTATAP
jgi:cobalt-zinc-cadmium resistance protein CzcA